MLNEKDAGEEVTLNGYHTTRTSVHYAQSITVSQSKTCTMRFVVTKATYSGGHKFKLHQLAVRFSDLPVATRVNKLMRSTK